MVPIKSSRTLRKNVMMSPMDAEPKQRDGRTVRAERTREALVGALLALLNEGRVRPTASEIAERAGVSERSVFQHFRDREALFEAVAREQYERVVPTIRPVDASLSLAGTRGRARDSALLDVREGGRRASRGAADGARV